MRFNPQDVPQHRRDEWAAVELWCARNSPPVGSAEIYNGQRMLWFVGDELHVDPYVFAECYGLPQNSSQEDIVERVWALYGDIEIDFTTEMI